MNKSSLQPQPDMALARRLKIVAWVATAIVFVLVASMRQIHFELPEGVSLKFLPAVHAVLNTIVALLLIIALLMIKRGNLVAHKRAVSGAMLCSILFLVCYVAYHTTTESTKFGGDGIVKVIYRVLLISHIVLAAVSLPFILFTWIHGFTNHIAEHRKMARRVFPMWLYVAITGPVCYLMLRPYYE